MARKNAAEIERMGQEKGVETTSKMMVTPRPRGGYEDEETAQMDAAQMTQRAPRRRGE